MPDNNKIYPLTVLAGIQRDGTNFSSRHYIDGQWVRFYRGLPQKMGGYTQLTGTLTNIGRGTYVIPNSPNFNIYIGDSQSLKYLPIAPIVDDSINVLGPLVNRTPVLFAANSYNLWSFEEMYSDIDKSSILIAHAAPNLAAIDNPIETPIYYGDTLSNTPLIPTGISTAGGVVALHPYLFIYGNSGDVSWTEANNPTVIMNSARVTAQKIVQGLATRGGNSSPAGLLWSLDSVIRVTQVGTNSIEFAFDTITEESSILSSRSVVEYDGIYYWAGIDRFLYYNGVVQELSNNMSLEYFFNKLNFSQRQKVWATKYTKKGEIWWHFPTGNNTECDAAVIYNIREEKWYDTSINRSSGFYDQTLAFPIWTDNVASEGTYAAWVHEIGNDQNINNVLTSIDSYFETGDIAWVGFDPNVQQQQLDRWMYLYRVEPDFIQEGEMNLTVKGRAYARAPVISSSPYTFGPNDVKIDMREQRREMTLRFESNSIGGYYEMGQVLMVMRIGDSRQ